MTKICLVSCLSLEYLDLKKAHIISCQETQPNLTVYDILLVSFAITLNHRRTFLLNVNTLACVKAEI